VRRGWRGGELDSGSSPGPTRGRTKGLTGGPHLSALEREGKRGRAAVWAGISLATLSRRGRGRKAAQAGPCGGGKENEGEAMGRAAKREKEEKRRNGDGPAQ
jgi:hypothetical protein